MELASVGVRVGRLDPVGSNRTKRATLHVFTREVPLPLERAEVIVHPVRRPNAHARADLSERGGVAAICDRLADVVEDHLLSLGQAYHDRRTVLNTRHAVKFTDIF